MFLPAVPLHKAAQDSISVFRLSDRFHPEHRRCFVRGVNNQGTKAKQPVDKLPFNPKILHAIQLNVFMFAAEDA